MFSATLKCLFFIVNKILTQVATTLTSPTICCQQFLIVNRHLGIEMHFQVRDGPIMQKLRAKRITNTVSLSGLYLYIEGKCGDRSESRRIQ